MKSFEITVLQNDLFQYRSVRNNAAKTNMNKTWNARGVIVECLILSRRYTCSVLFCSFVLLSLGMIAVRVVLSQT
jgi:hypothetical protein